VGAERSLSCHKPFLANTLVAEQATRQQKEGIQQVFTSFRFSSWLPMLAAGSKLPANRLLF